MKKGSLRGIDQALLEGIRDKNDEVIRKIYEDCFPGIRGFVSSRSGNLDDANDLFQDALIVVYKKCRDGDFELTCKLKTYLQAVCRRMWMNKIARRKGIHITDITEVEEEIGAEPDITISFHKQERERLYREYFSKLGADCQRILTAFMEGVKMRQIAAQMKIASEGAAKKRKFVCQQRLMGWIKSDSRYEELKYEQ